MRPVDQTSAALRALAKMLTDNEWLMTDAERERLTVAVFKALMGRPAKNGRRYKRRVNADVVSNR